MPLKITKDRSNAETHRLRESAEEFTENINKDIKSIKSLSESANSAKDALHEWNTSYKKFYQHMSDSYKMEEYKSWYVG